MIVEELPPAGRLGNINYLLACRESGEAVVIDPLSAPPLLALATARGYRVTHILVTHEHADHTAGIKELKAATGAECLAHHGAFGKIPEVDRGLHDGDLLPVGTCGRLQALETSGHTRIHLSFFCLPPSPPRLFCGDTLFGAGVGHCRLGGDPALLYATVERLRSELPPATRIYPGHDYLAENLRFACALDPGNEEAAALLAELADGGPPRHTTLAIEAAVSPFFRVRHPAIIAGLRRAFPDLPEEPDPETLFAYLRRLRDQW
jgi:hydroxyacylglutathione hydrolase